MALARLGVTIHEFLELTPLEFFLAVDDYDKTKEQEVQIIADTIRLSTWWNVNIQVKRKIRNPKRLWSHPWDRVVEKKPQTPEEMKNVMKAIAADTKSKQRKNQSKINLLKNGR